MGEYKFSSNKSKFELCWFTILDDIGSLFENKFRFHEFLKKYRRVDEFITVIGIGDEQRKFYLDLMKQRPLEIAEDEFNILLVILLYIEGVSIEFEEKSRKLFEKLFDIFISQDLHRKVGSMKPISGVIARVLEDSNLFGSVFELLDQRIKFTSNYSKKMEVMDENRSILYYYFRTYKLYADETFASWKDKNIHLFSQVTSTEEFANRWPKVEKYYWYGTKAFWITKDSKYAKVNFGKKEMFSQTEIEEMYKKAMNEPSEIIVIDDE